MRRLKMERMEGEMKMGERGDLEDRKEEGEQDSQMIKKGEENEQVEIIKGIIRMESESQREWRK